MVTAGSVILFAYSHEASRIDISRRLTDSGHIVLGASNSRDLVRQFMDQPVDLVILEAPVSGMDHLEACRQIRDRSETPVILLAGRSNEWTDTEALEAGVDYFLVKPFAFPALHTRITVALRRFSGPAEDATVATLFGDISIDFDEHRVLLKRKELFLTSTEFAMLSLFARHPGKLLSYEFILRMVWGNSYHLETNYVRIYVFRLRSKFKRNGNNTEYFVCQPRKGYVFNAQVGN